MIFYQINIFQIVLIGSFVESKSDIGYSIILTCKKHKMKQYNLTTIKYNIDKIKKNVV